MKKMLFIFIVLYLSSSIDCFPEKITVQAKISPSEINQLHEPIKYSINVENNENKQNLIEDTVKEVEAALKTNPDLPRLTRGEIMDLLENITKTDTKSVLQQFERKPKAVMKVLPFTPDGTSNNVEDLYTKPPVTQIVGSPGNDKDENRFNFQKYVDQNRGSEFKKLSETKTKKYNLANQGNENHMPTLKPNFHHIEPLNFELFKKDNRGNMNQISTATSPSTTPTTTPLNSSNRINYKKPIRVKTIKRKTTTIATTVKYPNHRYEESETSTKSSISSSSTSTRFPANAIKIISPPSLPPKTINDYLLKVSEEPIRVVNKKTTSSLRNDYKINYVDKKHKTKEDHVVFPIEIPDSLKEIMSDINFETAIKNMVKAEEINIQKPSGTKNIIASLGGPKSEEEQSTTPLSNIENVVDTLNPEMKDLLMNFGLIPNPDPSPSPIGNTHVFFDTYNPEVAEIKQESYVGFKPLPEDDNTRDEMQELLARYGLTKNVRKQKSFEGKNTEVMNMDLPKEYKDILKEIAWNGKYDDEIKSDTQSAASSISIKQHIFNPSENIYATKEEIEKLNKLSNVVKHLESLNRPLTKDDFNKIDVDTLNLLVKSLNNSVVPLNEQDAPDPLKLEYELIKNEVKRQENSTEKPESKNKDLEVTTVKTNESNDQTETKSTQSSTESSESSATPNIKDLEDSFGGQPETTTETKPVPKQTGFYYLLDWNSFFDIDDQKGRRVNLRFQPKAGDPKRFYSVSVP